MNKQEWEKEFDEYKLEEYGKWRIGRTEAKSFISSLLSKQREEIIGVVEGMKLPVVISLESLEKNVGDPNSPPLDKYKFMENLMNRDRKNYNQALDDIISRLKEMK